MVIDLVSLPASDIGAPEDYIEVKSKKEGS